MQSALIVAVIVIVAAVFIGLYIRRRQVAFEGEVIDKDVQEQVNNQTNSTNQPQGLSINLGNPANSNITHNYMIKVRTSSGEEISWQISEGKYQMVNIGDHVTKRSGTTDIDITSKVQGGPPATPPSTPAAPTPPSSISN